MLEKSNFEKQTEEITYKIYPYLIKDLRDIYLKDFDNKIIAYILFNIYFLFAFINIK